MISKDLLVATVLCIKIFNIAKIQVYFQSSDGWEDPQPENIYDCQVKIFKTLFQNQYAYSTQYNRTVSATPCVQCTLSIDTFLKPSSSINSFNRFIEKY